MAMQIPLSSLSNTLRAITSRSLVRSSAQRALANQYRMASSCPFANGALRDPTAGVGPARKTLTDEQKQLIKATVPALQAHGNEITKTFYARMLGENPPLRNIFNNSNQVNGHQPRALAGSVLAYAQHIDNLGALGSAVELIAHKHASLYIRPEQYAIVGKYLMQAIVDVLGDAVTPEIGEAWETAYWQLADILIRREDELYRGTKGWTDWADFRIARKVKESDEITSFYLEPVNEASKPLPPFLPGQYISIQTNVPQLGYRQSRQYSLSDSPGHDYYRISVKKEAGLDLADPIAVAHPGLMSNLLHNTKDVGDVIQVSHPMGDFFLDPAKDPDEKDAPLVLMSGGVGLTCLMSILNSLVTRHSKRPVSWIHAARTPEARAFVKQLKDIEQSHSNIRSVLTEGLLDLAKLDKEKDLFAPDSRTQYYVCGPTSFMLDTEKTLKAYGVDANRIHMELFGTGGVVRA